MAILPGKLPLTYLVLSWFPKNTPTSFNVPHPDLGGNLGSILQRLDLFQGVFQDWKIEPGEGETVVDDPGLIVPLFFGPFGWNREIPAGFFLKSKQGLSIFVLNGQGEYGLSHS